MPLLGRIKLLVALNVAMTVVVPLMGLGSDGAGVRGLLRGWTSTLVYTTVTAIPTLLVGPQLVEWLALHKWPLRAAAQPEDRT